MGPQVVVLGVDMRSERTKARILPQVRGGLVGNPQRALQGTGSVCPPSVPGAASHDVATCVCKIPAAAAAQSTPYCHPCCHPHPASQSAYDLLEGAVASLPPGPQHLVVLSGVPLIFPTVGRMHVLHLRAHDPTLLRHPASATFSAPARGSPV